MVNKVFYYNTNQYPSIESDYREAKARVEKNSNQNQKTILNHEKSELLYPLEAIPTFRRVVSIPDKLQNGETATALGMASLALINLPEDCRDVKGAINQLRGKSPNYDYKEFQHDFSFFRGTAIEKWLYEKVKANKKWAHWLYNNDKTLADTSFGEKINKFVNATEKDVVKTNIKDYKGRCALATSYNSSMFGELTARSLKRTTLLGVTALTLLELPKIIKSKETINQAAKSSINIVSITAGIGYGGAIGAKFGGATGSLIGMGAGAILGSKLSERTQQFI